jgi:hypothetical protein
VARNVPSTVLILIILLDSAPFCRAEHVGRSYVKNLYHHRWLLVIWACFIVRGIFYCSVWPLWEGFDEWAHFGVAQEMSTTGRAIIDRSAPLSKEINASLELAPLPRGMTDIPRRASPGRRIGNFPCRNV